MEDPHDQLENGSRGRTSPTIYPQGGQIDTEMAAWIIAPGALNTNPAMTDILT